VKLEIRRIYLEGNLFEIEYAVIVNLKLDYWDHLLLM